MKGYVYILSNPWMPGILKIGRTTRTVEGRINELYQTGVPAPFVLESQVLAPNCEDLEISMHEHFDMHRVNPAREFFKIEVHQARSVLFEYCLSQVEDLVDEFIPGFCLEPAGHHVGALSIGSVADEASLERRELVQAIEQMEPCDAMHLVFKNRQRREAQNLNPTLRAVK